MVLVLRDSHYSCFLGLLISWARVITEMPSFAPSLSECHFARLLSLYAYKQDDISGVETIVDCTMRCSGGMIRAEILISPSNDVSLPSETIVDGYMLVEAKFGADLDLKEEVFRNFAALFSTVTLHMCLIFRTTK